MNDFGMFFSQGDLNFHSNNFVDGHLGVSDRSCMKADRNRSSAAGVDVVAGNCTPTPLPHKKWSN